MKLQVRMENGLLLIILFFLQLVNSFQVDNKFTFSTYLGGSGTDIATSVKVQPDGRTFVGGYTQGNGFPMINGFRNFQALTHDAFISVFDSKGNLTYSTAYGGELNDELNGLAVVGNMIYITGTTSSTNMTLVNGYGPAGQQDCFVAIIDLNSNSLNFSTFLGGSDVDNCARIAVDLVSGNFFVVGYSLSTNFRGAIGPKPGLYEDAFVSVFGPSGSLLFTRFLGGSGFDAISDLSVKNINSQWILYVGGLTSSSDFPVTSNAIQGSLSGTWDGWVAVFVQNGNASVSYASYFGGDQTDKIYGIAVDNSYIYICGESDSDNITRFANAVQQNNSGDTDAFLAIFNLSGNLVYFTFLGGLGDDEANSVHIDSQGNAFITGYTYSPYFPVTSNAMQFSGIEDGFISVINYPSGSLLYSTYVGGNSTQFREIAVANNAITVVGSSDSNYYLIENAYQSSSAGSVDAVISQINYTSSVPSTATTQVSGGTTGSLPNSCGLCLSTPQTVVSFQNNTPTFTISPASSKEYVKVDWISMVEKDVNSNVVQSMNFPSSGYDINTAVIILNGNRIENVNFTTTIGETTIRISNYLYQQDGDIIYGGKEIPIQAENNKVSIEIWNWTFSNSANSLTINLQFETSSPITQVEQTDVIQNILQRIIIFTKSIILGINLISFAVIDDTNIPIQTNIKTDYLGIQFPSFKYLYYDPDFSILVDGDSAVQHAGSQSGTSQMNIVPYALGAIGFAIIMAIVMGVSIKLYLKHIRKHRVSGITSYTSQVSERFSRVHLTPIKLRNNSDGNESESGTSPSERCSHPSSDTEGV